MNQEQLSILNYLVRNSGIANRAKRTKLSLRLNLFISSKVLESELGSLQRSGLIQSFYYVSPLTTLHSMQINDKNLSYRISNAGIHSLTEHQDNVEIELDQAS